MIPVTGLDGAGPVQLLHENQTGQLVGEGQARERKTQIRPL